MVRRSGWVVLLSVVLTLSTTDTLHAASYFGFDDIGRRWYDVEKSRRNSEDDQLCWAATAANMLAYTGWGFPEGGGFTGAEDIFAYFRDHWTDVGGNMYFAVQWWFDGVNRGPQEASWSQVDVRGGGFHPDADFDAYYRLDLDDATAMASVDAYLHDGNGVGLTITDGRRHHAITAWGLEIQGANDYTGVYVTDSDDDPHEDRQSDWMAYYDIHFFNERWYLQNYNDRDEHWYITEVQGLAQMPGAPVPIPSSGLLLLTGLLLLRVRKKSLR